MGRLIEDRPILDLALTLTMFATIGCFVWVLVTGNQMAALADFAASLVGAAIGIPTIKFLSKCVYDVISTAKARKKNRNRRKFGDQAWQGVIHLGVAIYEVHLIAAHSDWAWWNDAKTIWEPLGEVREQALRRMYMLQVGIWFATALCHKFIDAKHKDYFVMYAHHVVTIGLIVLSYFNNWVS